MLPRRFCLPRTISNLGIKAKPERGGIRALALGSLRTFLYFTELRKA